MVARQVPEKTRGAALAAPPLLITRSQVRVLPGEPTFADFRDTPTNLKGSCADACAKSFEKAIFEADPAIATIN